MKKLTFFLPLFLYSAPIINPFNTNNINFNSYLLSDFSYINDLFFNKKYKHYKNKYGKNFAVLFLRSSIGYNKNLYNIGIFKQENFLLQSNKDTAKFVFQLLNNTLLQRNTKYNLFIKLKGFETQGIYFNKLFKLNKNLSLIISNDVFNVLFMQDGIVTGNGEIYNQDNYNYYAHTKYFYTKNFLYKIKVKNSNGYGYNSHIGIKYQKNDFKFQFLINNLISYIKIKNNPYSNVYLNSNNKNYKEGYITYSPLFYGKEYYKDYVGYDDKKYYVLLAKNNIYIEYFKWKKFNLKYIGFKQKNCSISYELKNKSINLNSHKNKYFFNIETNNINYKKATILQLSFGINFKF